MKNKVCFGSEWKNLSVGDKVCDRNFEHLKIIKIEKDFFSMPIFDWYHYVPLWTPEWIDEILYNLYCKGPTQLSWVDSTLTLENGERCSARYSTDIDNYWND